LLIFNDVAIPGILGLVLLIWPESIFFWSRVKLTPKEIWLLRLMGSVLILMAAIHLAIKFAIT